MKNPKTLRNIWIFSGFAFLLPAILYLLNNRPIIVVILEGIACTASFINAYNYHKKLPKT